MVAAPSQKYVKDHFSHCSVIISWKHDFEIINIFGVHDGCRAVKKVSLMISKISPSTWEENTSVCYSLPVYSVLFCKLYDEKHMLRFDLSVENFAIERAFHEQ